MQQIRRTATEALAMACLQGGVDAAYFCLAGADLPEDFALLRPALEELGLGRRVELNNDMMAALRSGTDSRNAVVVGWGSGTNALGRNAAGQELRLPALGWMSGDWGGGDDLARKVVWLVARAHDGRGQPTALRDPVLAALDVPDEDEMIRLIYLRRRNIRHLRRLPPILFQVADAGDEVAREVVQAAAREVVTTAMAFLRRLDLLGMETDVVLAGSVFRARNTLLMNEVEAGLQREAPLARIVMPDVEPIVGAFLCAVDMLGKPVDAGMRQRARQSYEELTAQREVRTR
jgi:N-acetylglucosamine kinase-like BadF-type ATPase